MFFTYKSFGDFWAWSKPFISVRHAKKKFQIINMSTHTIRKEGYESMAKQTEKIKPVPKKATPVEEKSVRGTKPVANKQNTVKPKAPSAPAKAAPPTSGRKKDDDVDTSPLLVVNNLKHQMTIDESKLKVLKWNNFTQPREEFVDLLRDQMTAANVNKMLMFRSDFRFHIKAIESLTEGLPPERSETLVSNLDLTLKWLTLRFFDTNPSVLLKGLEHLNSVFNMPIEKQYHMLENEGFIPYLVLKIGDPKDSVRNGVRSLLKQISGVFSVSLLSVYVMKGVKSKNARQGAKFREGMSSMIDVDDYSITVCQPTPAACLKEVAKQISDGQAYDIVGEKVYKMVGNSLKIAQAQDVPLQSQRNSLSNSKHNMLTDIFQKIGSKEDTKEGLNLLYDFMQQHPEADIEPFLSKSSKFFQEYIKNGLKAIDIARKLTKTGHSDIVMNNKCDEQIDAEKTPEYYQERLSRWRHVWDEQMAGKKVDHSLWPLPPPGHSDIVMNNKCDEQIDAEKTPEYYQERLSRWRHVWDEQMAGKKVDHSLWPLPPPGHSDIVMNNKCDEQIDAEKTPEYYQERLSRWRHVWDEQMAGKKVDHSLWPLPPNQ